VLNFRSKTLGFNRDLELWITLKLALSLALAFTLFACSRETPRSYVCSPGMSFSFYKNKAIWGENSYDFDFQKGNLRYFRDKSHASAGLKFDDVSEQIYLIEYKGSKPMPDVYPLTECRRVNP